MGIFFVSMAGKIVTSISSFLQWWEKNNKCGKFHCNHGKIVTSMGFLFNYRKIVTKFSIWGKKMWKEKKNSIKLGKVGMIKRNMSKIF